MMNYNEALAFIHSTPKFSRVLGNDLLNKLLNVLGNPQNNLKFVHIAGTNGKGSTASMTASVLKKAGYRTGLFTSPFIEKFNERIQINSVPIPNDKLATLTEKVKTAMEENDAPVSEFALITAIAFLYFKEEACDIVILEVGLGGRLDATNVIKKPLVSAITSIGFDHTQYLGDTLDKIATEKCGIIKENVPVVLYPVQDDIVTKTVENVCFEKNSELIIPALPEIINNQLVYDSKSFSLSLKGTYQFYNATVVIEIVKLLKQSGFNITYADLKYGLENTVWIARYEFLTPDLVIDGSHNPAGVKELISDLKKENRKITLIIAMMEDKEYKECVKLFSEIADTVIITKLNLPRCLKPEALALEFKKYEISPILTNNTKDAIKLSKKSENLTCVSGSLYLAGEIRANLSNI